MSEFLWVKWVGLWVKWVEEIGIYWFRRNCYEMNQFSHK